MNWQYSKGFDPRIVIVARPRRINVSEGTRHSSVIGSIYYRHQERESEKRNLLRRTKRGWFALVVAFCLTPIFPVCAYGTEIAMLAMLCGRPIEQQKRQNFD